MASLTDVLKALSDQTRLRMVSLLYEGELCVCDVMETLQISQAKASRHLIYLKNAGMVRDRKQAQWAYYSIVRDRGLGFIDKLVYENLRPERLYQDDLQRLTGWLDRKTAAGGLTACDKEGTL